MMRLALSLMLGCGASHSVVIVPRPRNAIDADTPLFRNGTFPKPDGTPGCTPTTAVCGCWCTNGTSPCLAAQTCFWFSQGCTIGCPACTGYAARDQIDVCGNGMRAK